MAKKPSSKAKTSDLSKRHQAKGRPKTKKQTCINLLKRPKGASLAELKKATGWRAHTVRGFLSRTVRRMDDVALVSEQSESGDRRYRIELEKAS